MKILLPTDLSNDSLKAIHFAMKMFGKGHEWTLLHCYHTPHAGASMLVKIDDILSEQSRTDLAAFKLKVIDGFDEADHPIAELSEHGEVIQVVDLLAKRDQFDLIAMGTTGASGLKEVLFGSVAAKVIEHAILPVLAVPANAEYRGIDKIAIADDEVMVSASAAANIILEIIAAKDPEVLMVNVSPDEEKVYNGGKGVDTLFSSVDRTHHLVNHSDVEKGLRAFNKEQKIDLMVMYHRKESGFIEWLTVSTSEEMAMRVRIPLFVLRA